MIEVACQGANLTRIFAKFSSTQSPFVEVEHCGEVVGRTRPHEGGDRCPRWNDEPIFLDSSRAPHAVFRVMVAGVLGQGSCLCGEGKVDLRTLGQQPSPCTVPLQRKGESTGFLQFTFTSSECVEGEMRRVQSDKLERVSAHMLTRRPSANGGGQAGGASPTARANPVSPAEAGGPAFFPAERPAARNTPTAQQQPQGQPQPQAAGPTSGPDRPSRNTLALPQPQPPPERHRPGGNTGDEQVRDPSKQAPERSPLARKDSAPSPGGYTGRARSPAAAAAAGAAVAGPGRQQPFHMPQPPAKAEEAAPAVTAGRQPLTLPVGSGPLPGSLVGAPVLPIGRGKEEPANVSDPRQLHRAKTAGTGQEAAATPAAQGEQLQRKTKQHQTAFAAPGQVSPAQPGATQALPVPDAATPAGGLQPTTAPATVLRQQTGHTTPTPGGAHNGSSGSTAQNGGRLGLSAKGRQEATILMQSKDKLRQFAEKPFLRPEMRGRTHLGYAEFRAGLGNLLSELDITVPEDEQILRMFEKHRHGGPNGGVGREEFEALIFRLLCFMLASGEVKANRAMPNAGEERDKRWREEFLKKNSRSFSATPSAMSELMARQPPPQLVMQVQQEMLRLMTDNAKTLAARCTALCVQQVWTACVACLSNEVAAIGLAAPTEFALPLSETGPATSGGDLGLSPAVEGLEATCAPLDQNCLEAGPGFSCTTSPRGWETATACAASAYFARSSPWEELPESPPRRNAELEDSSAVLRAGVTGTALPAQPPRGLGMEALADAALWVPGAEPPSPSDESPELPCSEPLDDDGSVNEADEDDCDTERDDCGVEQELEALRHVVAVLIGQLQTLCTEAGDNGCALAEVVEQNGASAAPGATAVAPQRSSLSYLARWYVGHLTCRAAAGHRVDLVEAGKKEAATEGSPASWATGAAEVEGAVHFAGELGAFEEWFNRGVSTAAGLLDLRDHCSEQ